jgi:RimJ/RimL family protein N-acetyltransferase
MHLVNNNLVIRTATLDDANILCQWWNDGKVMAHAGFPNGLGTTVDNIEELLSYDTSSRRFILEIDSIPVGEMNYSKVGEQIAEIGIKICDFTQQERGHGTKFIKVLINYLFYEAGFNKIILDTNANNKRAQHVYENIGFKKLATNNDAFKNQLGDLQSLIDYELNKSDYIKQ